MSRECRDARSDPAQGRTECRVGESSSAAYDNAQGRAKLEQCRSNCREPCREQLPMDARSDNVQGWTECRVGESSFAAYDSVNFTHDQKRARKQRSCSLLRMLPSILEGRLRKSSVDLQPHLLQNTFQLIGRVISDHHFPLATRVVLQFHLRTKLFRQPVLQVLNIRI